MADSLASVPVALLGPLNPSALGSWFAPADIAHEPLPYQQGGALLTSLLNARLRRGMKTVAITSHPAATEPIMRWSGPLLRLWVVRRRIRGALRDGYREEVRLLREALREADAPITHAHWTYEYALAAFGRHCPSAVVTVHDHAWNMLKLLGLRYVPHYVMSRAAFRRADGLTAPSPYVADYVTRHACHDVRVIPNLLDDTLLGARPRRVNNSGAATIATLGSDAPYKNIRGALLAFATWRARGATATLRVVGPGLQPDGEIAAWARAHNLVDGVRFEGPVTHPEALTIIAESDLCFHPSLEESFGGPVMEAMALGVPVVAAREAGGCRFLLDDGRCGRLASGRSPDDMARALTVAWTNTDETVTLSAAAEKRVRTICDPDAVLKAYEDCYVKMAGA